MPSIFCSLPHAAASSAACARTERGPWSTPPGQGPRRRLCIDDEKKALDDAELEAVDASRAVERGRNRLKRTKQKRIKLMAMGKLKERLRNQPFDQRLAMLDTRIVELKRELKAAKVKVKVRAAWALRDARCEDLDESAAEVAPFGYTRAELGQGVQLFACCIPTRRCPDHRGVRKNGLPSFVRWGKN
jgi:hypothetical protein